MNAPRRGEHHTDDRQAITARQIAVAALQARKRMSAGVAPSFEGVAVGYD